MNILFKIVIVLLIILFSCSYFLLIYNTAGFSFTPSCLFKWGVSIASWVVALWIVYSISFDSD